MPKVTLLARIYNCTELRQLDKILKLTFKDLQVETKVLGTNTSGWVQVALYGQDESVAAKYLAGKIGFCPALLENVERFSTLKGYVATFEKSAEELCLDIGVFEPKTVYVRIPLRFLQAQLVDGRKLAMKKIGELFGFCDNLPLSVKIVFVDGEKSRIEAMMSERQLDQYRDWNKSLLDRLIVLGSSAHEVETALNDAGLKRDVISVESLGMFEHALVCKLGTDAAGLISKIGRILRDSKFTVFNPRKLRKFLEV